MPCPDRHMPHARVHGTPGRTPTLRGLYSPTATKRSSSRCGALRPHPMQRRTGTCPLVARIGQLPSPAVAAGSPASASSEMRAKPLGVTASWTSSDVRSRPSAASRADQLGVRRDRAVPRAWLGGIRAAASVAEHRDAARHPTDRLVLERLGALGGEGRLVLDVDPPSGQACGQLGVHALAPDGQRELVVGDDDRRLAVLVVDEHLTHARRRERFGDVPRRFVVERDDVDLLAAQLADDHAHARPAGADAGADGIDALDVRDHGDLRAPARARARRCGSRPARRPSPGPRA